MMSTAGLTACFQHHKRGHFDSANETTAVLALLSIVNLKDWAKDLYNKQL